MRLWTTSTRLQPIRAIEWVLVATSLVQGLYIFSPLYQDSLAVNGASAFVTALAHPVLFYIFISLLVITAVIIAIGIKKGSPRLRASGLFGQAMLRLFNILTTVLVSGFTPISWIYAFTVMLICIVLWLAERIEVKRNATT